MRLVVATTYPEPSVLAIAREAERSSCLARLFTTLHPGPWMSGVGGRMPSLRLRRELARRSLSDFPASAVSSVAPSGELLHRAARLLPGSEAVAQALEDRSKAWFDAAVARRVGGIPADAVVGMPGSAERTLGASRESGKLAVLNMVNGHPRWRNLLLIDLAGLPPGHHELAPEAVIRSVDRELEAADLVLAPSWLTTDQLHKEGMPADRVVVCPYAVDRARFQPASHEPASKDAPLRCLFVGQVCYRKGVATLLEAARRLQKQRVSFELIGPCRAPELLRELPANVSWLGSLPQTQVAARMREADALLLPSIEDAYGLVTVEAMASGVPVVVSDRAGSSELVTDGENGLVVRAGYVSSLVLAVERLLDDPESRRAMGMAAHRKVEAGPSWEVYGQQVLRCLGRELHSSLERLEPAPA